MTIPQQLSYSFYSYLTGKKNNSLHWNQFLITMFFRVHWAPSDFEDSWFSTKREFITKIITCSFSILENFPSIDSYLAPIIPRYENDVVNRKSWVQGMNKCTENALGTEKVSVIIIVPTHFVFFADHWRIRKGFYTPL